MTSSNCPIPLRQSIPGCPSRIGPPFSSPFAALTGHGDAIQETARLTDRRIELDDDTKAMLDLKQQILADRIAEHPEISVVWFRADKKKDGGQYVTTTGQLKKVDDIERTLRLVTITNKPSKINIAILIYQYFFRFKTNFPLA